MSERSVAEHVDELVTIGHVAKLAKWRRDRMWRRLKALDEKHGGGLLQNVSRGTKPRFLVGLRALKIAWPGLFVAVDLNELSRRVDALEERADDLARIDEMLAREIGNVRAQTTRVEKKMEQLRLVS